jgi:peptide/nickel transport system substrate-binding protein
MKRRSVLAFVFVVMVVLLVAGWGRNGKAGDAFIINSSTAPLTLDPATVADTASIVNLRALYATLLQYGQKPIAGAPRGVHATRENQDNIVPYLAKSYKVSPNGRTFTFTLRRGVKFTTGRSVDCAAVLASFERGVKVNNGAAYYARAGQPDLNVDYACPGRYTFVATIARREVLFLHMFAQPHLSIVDVAEINAHGGDGANLPAQSNQWIATHTAGAGPYVLQEYSPGVREVLQANPAFFGKKPLEKTVIVNFVSDSSTLLLQARNDGADVTLGLPKSAVKSLRDDPCCNIVTVPTHQTMYIALPNKVEPFDNRMFRQALTYAVPYREILQQVVSGYGRTGWYGPYAPLMRGFNSKLEKPRAFDLAKARALIKESGVTLPVNADLMILDSALDMAQIATIVQNVWKGLGINLTIRSVPSTVYSSPQGIFGANKWPLLRTDGPGVVTPLWGLDYDMRCETFPGNTNSTNTSDFCSLKAEDLLNKAHRAQSSLQTYWDSIAKIWIAASPRIPLYAEDYTAVMNKDVHYWTYNYQGIPFGVAAWGR